MAMIAAIRRMMLMIQGSRLTPEELARIGKTYDFRIALAALLVHAGNVDGAFVETERQTVRALLADKLGISAIDASELMILVNYRNLQDQELAELVRALADALGLEGRVQFIDLVWRVVVSDSVVTLEERDLIAALADKLGVPPAETARLAALYTAAIAD